MGRGGVGEGKCRFSVGRAGGRRVPGVPKARPSAMPTEALHGIFGGRNVVGRRQSDIICSIMYINMKVR